jgi:hypothetical protein
MTLGLYSHVLPGKQADTTSPHHSSADDRRVAVPESVSGAHAQGNKSNRNNSTNQ